ncbi:BT1A1 protein, partial [Polyodon spathula]|nr:butyrophilin subfamily 1 member A1-like [Polyodon spathula]MBN3282025.1 BT1A1 protein [Polyodon spathula]
MAHLRELFISFLLCGAVESSLRCEENVQGKPYHSVTFTCLLDGGHPQDVIAVTWKKGDEIIAQAIPGKEKWKREVVGDPRAELIEEKLQKGEVSMHLKDVHYTDHGSYHCTVATRSRKWEGVVKLSVEEPEIPKVVFNPETGIFTCKSIGWYREPEVQWTNEKGENLTGLSETAPAEQKGEVYRVQSVLRISDLHQHYICTVKEGKMEKAIRNIITPGKTEL